MLYPNFIKRLYLLLLLITSCTRFSDQSKTEKVESTNIDSLVQNASAKEYLSTVNNDSLRLALAFDVAYYYYKKIDSTEFRYWNNYSRNLAFKVRDTTSIAESYWDAGNFFYRLRILDSSYYYYQEAQNYYEMVDSTFNAGRILMNMATIQSSIQDYTGSEITTIEAIKRFETFEANDQLYMAYNNLGIVANGMNDFSDAINYHKRAISYIDNKSHSTKYSSSLNNIGVVLKDSGNYMEAVKYYQLALKEDSLKLRNPRLYAMLLDNRTYIKMKMGDTTNLLVEFLRARTIRDSINNRSGILASDLHLGEYYMLIEKDSNKAKETFLSARDLSKNLDSYTSLLESILFLSQTDLSNRDQYLKEYISLNDSLLIEERALRNKFTRIQFQTQKFIDENKDLNYQNRNILIGFSILILFLTLIYLIRNQRINNKRLLLEKQQIEANEEIYKLLLQQKTKLAEGKNQEKKRISTELHDGVLGNLFGIRMTLSSLNDNSDQESISTRERNIDELQKLENEIRNISHDLYSDQESTEIDLINIVEDFFQNQQSLKNKEINVDFDDRIDWEQIAPTVKINIFRIIQESVFNAIKYSGFSKLSIFLKKKTEYYILNIADNGSGFDSNKVKMGLGIQNIYSRVQEMNGEIELKSDSLGTQYFIKIPLSNE